MTKLDLRECGLVEPSDHWYYKSKSRYIFSTKQISGINPSQILDVGAGSAFFLKEAKKLFPNARYIAMDPNYKTDQIGIFDGIEYTKNYSSDRADLILMIDVIEHIEDDLRVLSNYAAKAPSGSIFLVSVPAFQFLWSPHDVFLGHHRRYTLNSLKKLIEGAGLVCLEEKYLFGPILPIVYLVRLIKGLKMIEAKSSDMKKPSAIENFILTQILKSTHWPNKNRIAGTSAFIVATKI